MYRGDGKVGNDGMMMAGYEKRIRIDIEEEGKGKRWRRRKSE